jgi:HSP20 family protein
MNKNLVISMEKKSKNEEKKNNRYLRREFSYSKFQQTIVLSDNVNKDNISAQVENGVLTIGIPKLDVEEFSKEVKIIEIK